MPPVGAALMAAGEFAIGAVSSITLSGLATGASIVGAGLQVVGGITGSKTLQKIGTGFSIAGGAGFAANALRGATSITGGISKTGGLLQADNIDDILSQPLKGSKLAAAKNTQGFNKIDFAGSGSSLTAADSFKSNAGKVGSGVNFDPEIEKSFWQRASSTITGYDPTLNILGGMGQAYLMNEQMQLQKDLLDKKLGFEQQLVDIQKQAAQPIGVTYSPPASGRTPLLLRNN